MVPPNRTGPRLCAVVGAALSIAVLAGSCELGDEGTFPMRESGPPERGGGARIVGLVGTMSGPDSWRGQDAYEGADLGVHSVNRARPEGETAFQLQQLDDRGDPERALALVRRLAADERTVGIVYAGPPEALPKAEGALASARIPAILCFGDLYSAHELSAHVFQASPPLLWQARRIAPYLLEDRGYRRLGALVEASPQGSVAARALTAAVVEEAGRPPAGARYEPDGEGIAAALAELRRRRVEAVVVHGGPDGFNRVLEQLRAMGARYRSTAAARTVTAPRARRGRPNWRPQVVGFDEALSERIAGQPGGAVASDTYARGAHYLPVPSLTRFRRAFRDWWGESPRGWELRAFDAVSALGWASRRANPEADPAQVLERMRSKRFGGLDITLGPDDHTLVGQTTVGLWVVPRRREEVREERFSWFEAMPWVLLARGFSTDGERTDILPRDWRFLFRNPPPQRAPAPRLSTMRFGVTTKAKDRFH